MRVRCTQILEISGPERGRQLPFSPHLAVGDEFTVLALMVDETPGPLGAVWLQIYDERRSSPSWWPGRMFVTTSATIPSNWTSQLWTDGSLHVAPHTWLEEGFWEAFFDDQRAGSAAEAFRREAETILREA